MLADLTNKNPKEVITQTRQTLADCETFWRIFTFPQDFELRSPHADSTRRVCTGWGAVFCVVAGRRLTRSLILGTGFKVTHIDRLVPPKNALTLLASNESGAGEIKPTARLCRAKRFRQRRRCLNSSALSTFVQHSQTEVFDIFWHLAGDCFNSFDLGLCSLCFFWMRC
jgi:hypothetical protein